MTRSDIITLIESRYFGSVMRADLPAIRACFTPDATVLIRHGDNPTRHFDAVTLMDFYTHICGNYECWFGNFEHTLDLEALRAASRFRVRLTPRPTGLYAAAPAQILENCNFFDLTPDNLIRQMVIYYANPNAAPFAPTGYPQP
jgi:hypothetical protein